MAHRIPAPALQTNMPFPGIIIAASVLVAAGIAIYQDEQVRMWFDERRRRIAIAIYNVGDGIHPQPPQTESERAAMIERNRDRRLDIVRRNRLELLRRAQADGMAVDLDELSRIGNVVDIPVQDGSSTGSHARTGSFDDLVDEDGKLKADQSSTTATASALEDTSSSGLRHRGVRGFDAGASFANPFDDEAHVLFDHSLIAPSESELYAATQHEQANSVTAETGTIRSVTPRPASTEPSLIEIPVHSSQAEWENDGRPQYKSDEELAEDIEEAIRRSLQDIPIAPLESQWTGSSVDSLYAPPTPRANALQAPLVPTPAGESSRQPEMSQIPSLSLASPIHSTTSATISPALHSTEDHMDLDLQSISDYMSLDGEVGDEGELIDRANTPFSVSTLSSATFASSEAMDDDADAESEFDSVSRPETPAAEVSQSHLSTLSVSRQTVLPSSSAAASSQHTIQEHTFQERTKEDDESSESEFSVVEAGASTPGSWTDVDTDGEEEVGNGVAAARR
jgi:hypothetical protein